MVVWLECIDWDGNDSNGQLCHWGNSIVAAGAVVTQNTTVGQDQYGLVFLPEKWIDQSDFAGEIERISNNYVMYSVGSEGS
jgi:hypothetical protein